MTSPNVTKVLIMLEELQIPYSLHHVNVFRGDQFEPSFIALNPLSKVPVIIDDDDASGRRIVFESGAILIYLAERHARFLPPMGPARYEILEWLMLQLSNIGPIFGQFTHFRRLAPTGNEYSLSRYGNLAVRLYRLLEGRLAERRWIAGDDYSIADMATYPWMRYVDWHGLKWSDFPNLKTWVDKVAERPAVIRADVHQAKMRPIDLEWMANASPSQLDRYLGRTE
jgi:GST-like protein